MNFTRYLNIGHVPKVLLVSTYEDALQVIHEYKEYLLCVISDVKFMRNGVDDEDAGIELLKFVNQNLRYPIPLLLQSHDVSNSARAFEINAWFINKNSDTLSHDINEFINSNLGFGDFIFRNGKGDPNRYCQESSRIRRNDQAGCLLNRWSIMESRTIFSTWLMARGEINIAERLMPYKTDEFDDSSKIRDICLSVFCRCS